MRLANIQWPLTIACALAAEAILIAAAFGWVAIYSHLLNPGHSLTYYQEYAQSASPWVSLIIGVPVFFFVARWAGLRRPHSAMPTAMGIFAIYCMIEIPIMVTAASPAMLLWFAAVNLPSKFASCYLGGRAASRHGVATHA